MIPQIIHYCWFGGKPLPRTALRCIESWRRFFPDYEVKEWNEGNFDVGMLPYTREAYAAGKYAFVSDFARFWILCTYGGLYFNTDVELIAPMADILAKGAYMGTEAKASSQQECFYVNPGLGCACSSGNPVWRDVIEAYRAFGGFDSKEQETVCVIATQVLEQRGIIVDGGMVESEHLTIYPPDYFCPQAMMAAPIRLTPNTRSIHHFDCSWLPWTARCRVRLASLIPMRARDFFRKLISR